MSGIAAGIAGSANQAAMQQTEAARAGNAEENKAAEQNQEMKRLLEQHLNEVEDSTETRDDRARIRDEERNSKQERRRRRQKEHQEKQGERKFHDEVLLSANQGVEKLAEGQKGAEKQDETEVRHVDVEA